KGGPVDFKKVGKSALKTFRAIRLLALGVKLVGTLLGIILLYFGITALASGVITLQENHPNAYRFGLPLLVVMLIIIFGIVAMRRSRSKEKDKRSSGAGETEVVECEPEDKKSDAPPSQKMEWRVVSIILGLLLLVLLVGGLMYFQRQPAEIAPPPVVYIEEPAEEEAPSPPEEEIAPVTILVLEVTPRCGEKSFYKVSQVNPVKLMLDRATFSLGTEDDAEYSVTFPTETGKVTVNRTANSGELNIPENLEWLKITPFNTDSVTAWASIECPVQVVVDSVYVP
ncbi:MAG: hypothetical protein M3Q24_00030, partial [bacterium]|nr:hypothetical protein [bacterium]